jgi:hypothetical protein
VILTEAADQAKQVVNWMEEIAMATEATRSDIKKFFATAAIEFTNPGAASLVMPWRVDTNQDLSKSLDECGCAFCPDDEQPPI